MRETVYEWMFFFLAENLGICIDYNGLALHERCITRKIALHSRCWSGLV